LGGGIAILRGIRRTDLWITVLAILSLVGVWILGAVLDSGAKEGAGQDPAQSAYSTHNAGDLGLKGLYTLLQANGVSVSRWRRPLSGLGTEVDRLVVWYPTGMTAGDWIHLDRWVRGGGTLVVATHLTIDRIVPGTTVGLVPVTAAAKEVPIDAVAVHPLTQGVKQLKGVNGQEYLSLPQRSGITVYAARGTGPVLVGWPLGKGQVYAVADPGFLANGYIREADNLTMAVNLLDPGRGKHLAFDEYHHGATTGEDWWQTLRAPLRWAMLEAVLAALVLIIWAGARLGTPVALSEGVSRSAVEFAGGLANLLRRSRGNRWVRDRLYQSFVAELCRYLGARPGIGHEELSRLWARYTGEPGDGLLSLLNRCVAPVAPKDHDLVAMVREMGPFRSRLQRRT